MNATHLTEAEPDPGSGRRIVEAVLTALTISLVQRAAAFIERRVARRRQERATMTTTPQESVLFAADTLSVVARRLTKDDPLPAGFPVDRSWWIASRLIVAGVDLPVEFNNWMKCPRIWRVGAVVLQHLPFGAWPSLNPPDPRFTRSPLLTLEEWLTLDENPGTHGGGNVAIL